MSFNAVTHSPALAELMDISVSRPVIGQYHFFDSPSILFFLPCLPISDYVVDSVVETVNYAMSRPSSSSHAVSISRQAEVAKFATFAANVITRAEVSMSTILGTLVYIDRAAPHLDITLEEWAHERVFLGALICASKVGATLVIFWISFDLIPFLSVP